jgi:S1-C subfamily serine protease
MNGIRRSRDSRTRSRSSKARSRSPSAAAASPVDNEGHGPAGLQRGDLLVSVDGQSVRTLRQLYRTIWRKAPGHTVGMQVLRDESIQVFEIVAGDRYLFFK